MQFSTFEPSLLYINMPAAADQQLQNACQQALIQLGIPFVTMQHLTAAAHMVCDDRGQTMPYHNISFASASRAQRTAMTTAQERFVHDVLACITIDTAGSHTRYLIDQTDMTDQVESTAATIDKAAHQQTWINGTHAYLADNFAAPMAGHPVAFVATDPRRFTDDKVNPVIGLLNPGEDNARTLRLRRKSDALITLTTDVDKLKQQIAVVVEEFTTLRERAAALRQDIQSGATKLEPQFSRDTWPGFALMTNVKEPVRHIVQQVISEQNILCDPLDLEYQTLFRLTSLPIADVFEQGEALEAYLQSQNAYGYWRNILALDPKQLEYSIKPAVVRGIVEEQLRMIGERLQKTTLPLDKLLHRQGIFAEADWKLQKVGGKLAAIKVHDGSITESREVIFKPVDTAYAKELHSALHYIHTPRAIKAFGLYLEDDPLPFSVVAFDAIDRPYKKDLLFMHGFNPAKCLDLARLYSRPGTPFNTSSTIFTLAFTYFREHEPDVQAILSAFMPTYAHGMSMISAGFDYGVLVKEWRHSFAKRTINGQQAWELVTKRRKDGEQITINSQWPLLPVFELMATLQPPRFTPFPELEGMMVSRGL